MVDNLFDEEEFGHLYNYDGELGVLYEKDKSKFVLWAPTADSVKLVLYGNDELNTNEYKKVISMNKEEKGIWTVEVAGDLNNEFYNYIVNVEGKENEAVDPYAKAVGVNGNRGMVIDLKSTNPIGWDNDKKPELKSPTDSIIYEMHVRDFTIDKDSGIDSKIKGKFIGLTQDNTTIPHTNVATGLSHLKELGVTHVHLLPSFDYASIDESKLDEPQYNWGYDPKNYNALEGSYSTNPYKGDIRIREFKQMVQKMHKEGIRVVMDVVYNHTFNLNSCLNLIVPKYYYRQDELGNYSDASACGNETASDRYMFRKYMIDSIVYWATEYHIDGFRFDLMGIHDIDTMVAIREALDNIDPSILIYGEGWTGGASPLPQEKAAIKENTYKFGELQIAAFSDDARDCVKGHVFYNEPGFANGRKNLEEAIKYTIVAATKHPQVNCEKAFYSKTFWANEPYQTVTYDSAHDNYTLWDKLQTITPNANEYELLEMNKLIAAIILTSQGINFLHAGEEFARTKVDEDGKLVENSYISSDKVNEIQWNRKIKYNDLFEYYKGLIQLRKKFKAFRMNTNGDICNNLKFMNIGQSFNDENVIAYTINAKKLNDNCDEIAVLINGNEYDVEVKLHNEGWNVMVNNNVAGTDTVQYIAGNIVKVVRKSVTVLIR